MTKKVEKLIAYSIVGFIFLIYILPFIILRQNTYITAWDNLDSYLAWYKVLSMHGWWQPLNAVIPNFLDGIPRNCFHSEFIFQVAILNFMSTFKAYVLIDVLGRVIGFLGLYLLLKDHILKDNPDEFIYCGCALTFCFMPHQMSMAFLTVTGVPLLFWAFLNIRKQDYRAVNWLIICLMPFCVNFELITPFSLFVIFVIWLYDYITTKKVNKIFLYAMIIHLVISFITIYRFIYLMLFQDFTSHRADWDLVQQHYGYVKSFLGSIYTGLETYIAYNGNGWDYANSSKLIMPVCTAGVVLSVIKHYKYKQIGLVWLCILLIAVNYGILSCYGPVLKLLTKYSFLRQFQITRFYFLMPMLWAVNFAIALDIIKQFISFKYVGRTIILIILALQLVVNYDSQYFYLKDNIDYLITKDVPIRCLSYKNYFSTNVFDEVKKYINKPLDEYKVAQVEMPYGVASFNGLHVMNDYFNIYPLEYKRKFEQIVKPCMDRNPSYKKFIKYWGHKQYIAADEFNFDTDKLKEYGCDYIISNRSILPKNTDSKIVLLKKFDGNPDGYPIYLYKIR